VFRLELHATIPAILERDGYPYDDLAKKQDREYAVRPEHGTRYAPTYGQLANCSRFSW
jgi:hypothetical protein